MEARCSRYIFRESLQAYHIAGGPSFFIGSLLTSNPRRPGIEKPQIMSCNSFGRLSNWGKVSGIVMSVAEEAIVVSRACAMNPTRNECFFFGGSGREVTP